MRDSSGWLQITRDKDIIQIIAGGNWTIKHVSQLSKRIDKVEFDHFGYVEIDFSQIKRMDTAGATLAREVLDQAENSKEFKFLSNERVDSILAIVDRYPVSLLAPEPRINFLVKKLENIGCSTVNLIDLAASFVEFIGNIVSIIVIMLLHPTRFRWRQTSSQVELGGVSAIPIIILISFLIGIVVAYQAALQLGKLGADVYTVDLLAVTILRELGILLTAIVIAGRSGSTFAAEIGSMKINQELDAMKTIGVDPMEILVIPRVVGLIIALPILTLLADIFGILGGGIMIWTLLGISPTLFISQFVNAVEPWTFWVGMIKAPVFASIIAVVGCYEGMQVSGSSESVGIHTTRAVVEAIFLIIVFDAIFSILFGIIGV